MSVNINIDHNISLLKRVKLHVYVERNVDTRRRKKKKKKGKSRRIKGVSGIITNSYVTKLTFT